MKKKWLKRTDFDDDFEYEAYVLTIFASTLNPHIDESKCYTIALEHLYLYQGMDAKDAEELAKWFITTESGHDLQ